MGIRKSAILLCVGVAALVIGSTASGTTRDVTSVAAKLKEKHDSGIFGTATLIPADKDVRVVLTLNKRVRALAHIHSGPCRNEPTFSNPRIYKSLNNVVRGKSVSIAIGTTLTALRARTFSINVHNPSSYGVIACADIPRA